MLNLEQKDKLISWLLQ